MKTISNESVFVITRFSLKKERIKNQINHHLKSESIKVFFFDKLEEAVVNMHYNPSLILLDYGFQSLPISSMSAFDFIKMVKRLKPFVSFVMLLEERNVMQSLNSVNNGAMACLVESDFSIQKFKLLVKRAFYMRVRNSQNEFLNKVAGLTIMLFVSLSVTILLLGTSGVTLID